MKRRLGLLLGDLTVRFEISSVLASKFFTNWVIVLSQTLGALFSILQKRWYDQTYPLSLRTPNLMRLDISLIALNFFM